MKVVAVEESGSSDDGFDGVEDIPAVKASSLFNLLVFAVPLMPSFFVMHVSFEYRTINKL
jgi:hypothetical protein